jgi:hypothetical protein
MLRISLLEVFWRLTTTTYSLPEYALIPFFKRGLSTW